MESFSHPKETASLGFCTFKFALSLLNLFIIILNTIHQPLIFIPSPQLPLLSRFKSPQVSQSPSLSGFHFFCFNFSNWISGPLLFSFSYCSLLKLFSILLRFKSFLCGFCLDRISRLNSLVFPRILGQISFFLSHNYKYQSVVFIIWGGFPFFFV